MRLPHRRPLAGLVALGAIALIAGCGGGSDDSSLSAEEFRSQADAICADTDRQVDALTEPTSADGVLPFLREGLPIQQAQLEKLRGLDPPDELQADFDEALGLLEQQTETITTAADRIEGGEDAEAVIGEIDSEVDSLGDRADAKAKELGLTVCGEDDDAADTTESSATAPAVPTDTAPAGGDAAAYVADVQEAAGALQEFGTLLQSTTSLDDLRGNIPEAQASLDTFDTAIARLDGYTLPDADLERQRSGLARTGPAVSDVLRRFLDAAGSGDLSAVQELVPEVTQRINEFQQAATG